MRPANGSAAAQQLVANASRRVNKALAALYEKVYNEPKDVS